MKSRGIYETPGGTILYRAHEELEHMCLDRETFAFKQQAAVKFAEITYNGQWFNPCAKPYPLLWMKRRKPLPAS